MKRKSKKADQLQDQQDMIDYSNSRYEEQRALGPQYLRSGLKAEMKNLNHNIRQGAG